MIRILPCDTFTSDLMPDRSAETARVGNVVEEIIADVCTNGDDALYRLSEKFDGARPASLEVPAQAWDAALDQVGESFRDILFRAAQNIEMFHKKQLREGFVAADIPGVLLGQLMIPLARAGIYVPGGTAAYPSTVLMNAIPARLAGVGEIIMCTPPSQGGKVAPEILAAAKVAGVTRVFCVGGAQAIAAMAHGTQSVPRVDKITGPGNAYVAEAKRQVYGHVGIDGIAGPSEILIVADGAARADYIAADMLAQAEHDTNAAAILVTDCMQLARCVAEEIERQLVDLPRAEIARASIDQNGRIFVVKSLSDAMRISNEIAPEHLEICVDEPFALLPLVKNAGSIFLGHYSPEALGDYFAGTNHTLPTAATARFASPLGVEDFVKRTQFTYYTRDALRGVGGMVAEFANREGLHAHARSVQIRTEGGA
ncbi:MAG: histidinol dehydrogenase [Christensenellales bacterium]|jgi:histidinol dehydrogenase